MGAMAEDVVIRFILFLLDPVLKTRLYWAGHRQYLVTKARHEAKRFTKRSEAWAELEEKANFYWRSDARILTVRTRVIVEEKPLAVNTQPARDYIKKALDGLPPITSVLVNEGDEDYRKRLLGIAQPDGACAAVKAGRAECDMCFAVRTVAGKDLDAAAIKYLLPARNAKPQQKPVPESDQAYRERLRWACINIGLPVGRCICDKIGDSFGSGLDRLGGIVDCPRLGVDPLDVEGPSGMTSREIQMANTMANGDNREGRIRAIKAMRERKGVINLDLGAALDIVNNTVPYYRSTY